MAEIERTSLLLGWMMGRRIAAQRKKAEKPAVFFNIAQTAGKVLTSRNGRDERVYTEYAAGSMPLSFNTYVEGSSTHGTFTNGNACNEVYFHPKASAGDFIEIYFTLPAYSADYVEVDGLKNQWCYLNGYIPEGKNQPPRTYFGFHQYSDWKFYHGSVGRMLGDDFTYEFFRDPEGKVTGFRFSGTLLHDVESFWCYGTLNYTMSGYPKGYNHTEFASYDDFRYRVQ